jgi:hypothetical protein
LPEFVGLTAKESIDGWWRTETERVASHGQSVLPPVSP